MGSSMSVSPWHICVLIPACNESELLPRCLRSIITARSKLPLQVTCDVVVAVDSSTDGTRELAENLLYGIGTVVSTEAKSVGQTRALATEIALTRYEGSMKRCWLANTDADCSVPDSWLKDQLALAEQNVEAVAGIVDVDSFHEHQPHVKARFYATYLIPEDGSHSHVHGANLGIRADAYLRAGGWAALTTAEDHDLWNRLRAAGSTILSIAKLRVWTSGRRVGRAPHGFADALAAHNEAAA